MVERGGLENRCTHSRTQGSNPCLSAGHYVYILQSQKDLGYYYGSSNDIHKRVKSHNSGKVRSTKHRRPLKLIYFENFASKKRSHSKGIVFQIHCRLLMAKKAGHHLIGRSRHKLVPSEKNFLLI